MMRRWSGILILVVAISGCSLFRPGSGGKTTQVPEVIDIQDPKFYRPGSSGRPTSFSAKGRDIEARFGFRSR